MNFNTNEYEKVIDVISDSTLQPTIICQSWYSTPQKCIYSQLYENVKIHHPFFFLSGLDKIFLILFSQISH